VVIPAGATATRAASATPGAFFRFCLEKICSPGRLMGTILRLDLEVLSLGSPMSTIELPHPSRSRLAFVPLAAVLFIVTVASAETWRVAFADSEPFLPTETRIEVGPSRQGMVAKVTLVFPDSGFRVAAWGPLQAHGSGFRVNVKAERLSDAAVLPVITEFSELYLLGPLAAGDYGFAVYSGEFQLAARKFRVFDPSLPAPPAKARLAVDASGERTIARVSVLFAEPGYAVVDWGEPVRHGDLFVIRAKAEKTADPLTDGVVEQRWKYDLGELPIGFYGVVFSLNGHELAKAPFAVYGSGSVHLAPGGVFEPHVPVHLLEVRYAHAAGVDLTTLDHHDLQVIGPAGFVGMARLASATYREDGEKTVAIARYEVRPPGQVWTWADNGRYHVGLLPDAVRRSDGVAFPAQKLGWFAVEIPKSHYPLPTGGSALVRPNLGPGLSPYEALVTLEIPSSEIAVTAWGAVERSGNRMWVDVRLDRVGEVGLPVIREESKRYPLWVNQPGEYSFTVYSRGHYVTHAKFTIDGAEPPVARAVSHDILEPSDHPHLWQIRYFAAAGMDLDSIRSTSPWVVGPREYKQRARFLKLESYHSDDGRALTVATYSTPAPPDGWSARWNGRFTIYLPPDSIFDRAGQALPGGSVGGFFVRISPDDADPEQPRVSLSLRKQEDGYYLDLEFLPGASQWHVAHWGRLHLRGNVFGAPIQLADDAQADALAEPRKSYRLGELEPGSYGFVAHSRAPWFISRSSFAIEGEPVAPIEQWNAAINEMSESPAEVGLFHYAFGLLPDEGTAVRLTPLLEQDAEGRSSMLLLYPFVAAASDLEYRIEVSKDLASWIDVTEHLIVRREVDRADGAQSRLVVVPVPPGEEPYPFARVRAVLRDSAASGP
jgi:hypothetical protein